MRAFKDSMTDSLYDAGYKKGRADERERIAARITAAARTLYTAAGDRVVAVDLEWFNQMEDER